MLKELRDLESYVKKFMTAYPNVKCYFEPHGHHLEVQLIAPNGRDRKVRVHGQGDKRSQENAIRDVKRALNEINVRVHDEKPNGAQQPSPRVLHSFPELAAAHALSDEVDTTPRANGKAFNGSHSNGHSSGPAPTNNGGQGTHPQNTRYDYTEAQTLRDQGKSLSEIASATGISMPAISRNTNPRASGGNGAAGALKPVEKPAEPVKKIQLNHGEMFRMGQLLQQHCHLVDGFAVYEDRWTDDIIASQVSERCTEKRVKEARIAYIGRTEAETPKNEAAPEIRALQKRLDVLEELVQGLLDRATKP
jgi:hypothetical protein